MGLCRKERAARRREIKLALPFSRPTSPIFCIPSHVIGTARTKFNGQKIFKIRKIKP
jgi:hypothetical protein